MMRLILPVLFSIPAAASACESMAAMPASGGCASGQGCGPVSIALMAATAALGVWVLRSVEKDGLAVKRAGQAVGWTLAAVGLLGFLCGAVNYGLKKRSSACHMGSAPAGAAAIPDAKLPPGHPPIGPSAK